MRRRLPLYILLVALLAGAAWLVRLDAGRHFTTDVTELLPADEQDPDAALALSLVRERQSRVILITVSAPASATTADLTTAADLVATRLRQSTAFVDAESLAGTNWRHALARDFHTHRFERLLPNWLAERIRECTRIAPEAASSPATLGAWLASKAVADLDAQLASPAGGMIAELAASDPLLLLPALAARAGDLSPTPPGKPERALIWAETRAGPLSEEGQTPVFAALEEAAASAARSIPGLELRYTGVHRFAAAAKASTREELSRLNVIALVGVLLVSVIFVRRALGLLHLIPLIAASTLGATLVTVAIFPRVHVLVFVIGALLSGVAVDYAFHVVLARRDGEPFARRARRLLLPLVGGAATTIAGFLALVFSELPLVRQLGVYVAAGIVSGLAVTLAYFSAFPDLDLKPRQLAGPAPIPSRRRGAILLLLSMLALAGLSRVRWNDDLRSLEYPSGQLRADDRAIRAEFGESEEGITLITQGATIAEAKNRWEALAAKAPAGAQVGSIAAILPRPDDYTAATTVASRLALVALAENLPRAAEAAGYAPGAFAPFLTDLADYLSKPPLDYETMARRALDDLPGPLGMLAHSDAAGTWFLSHCKQPIPLGDSIGSRSLSGIEGLNHLFARYRAATARLSLVGIVALVSMSCLLHGPRLGLRTAGLPLLATGLAFALLAVTGGAFGLFHLIGALLAVCLADDYAHFAHADDGTPLGRASIRLSALTTAASFGTLAFSAIPAVAALGIAVALVVLIALVFVETDLFSLRPHA